MMIGIIILGWREAKMGRPFEGRRDAIFFGSRVCMSCMERHTMLEVTHDFVRLVDDPVLSRSRVVKGKMKINDR